MERPTGEIKQYLDLNKWQVAGIQKAVASLDRDEGFPHEQVSGLLEQQEGATSPYARRHEYPVVTQGNRRLEFASSLHRARQSVRRASGRAREH